MPPVELTLPADAGSVALARRFLERTLHEWQLDEMGWTAAQVVSELATNAVIHAGTPFRVRLQRSPEGLRLSVHDGSRRAPRVRRYGLEATTGRGLALLGALTRDWGVALEEDGKTVWCELDTSPIAPSDLDIDAFLSPDDLAGLA